MTQRLCELTSISMEDNTMTQIGAVCINTYMITTINGIHERTKRGKYFKNAWLIEHSVISKSVQNNLLQPLNIWNDSAVNNVVNVLLYYREER